MQTLNEIIRKKQDAQDALLKMPGVTGVDVGYKYVNGKRTDEIAIRVMVSEKKKDVPAKKRIPAKIDGVKTDVIERVIVPMVARKSLKAIPLAADTTKYNPLKGGISIGPDRSINGYVYAGTLGCIVTDNSSGEKRLLSNFHVMAVDNGWHVGDAMDQPSLVDGGASADKVGTLTKAILSSHVDGALSTLENRGSDCSIVDIGDVKGTASAALNDPVRKRGRTTVLTYGFVDAINGSVKIDYGDGIGTKTLTNQIGIRPDTAHNPKFSDHGDSGSVVVDANNNIIGLLFAGSEDGYTYINVIDNVLSELDIKICTKTKTQKESKEGKEVKEKERERKAHKEYKEVKEFKESKEKDFKEWKEHYEKDLKQEFERYKYFDNFPIPGYGNYPGQMMAGLEHRLSNLEQTVGALSAFISREQRPDLSQGALRQEPDADQFAAGMRKEAEQDLRTKFEADNNSGA